MWVFFGILIFVFIFFPFFAFNLRYQLGYIFQTIMDYIGNTCLTVGGFLIILCVAGLIVGKSIKVGWFVVAIVLLWVGCWCTGVIIDFWGIIIGNSQNSGGGGYH